MPNHPIHRPNQFPAPNVSSPIHPRTARALSSMEAQVLLRAAAVQGEAIVATAKIQEIDRLAREAMTGHAFLRRWADTLAQNDPFLADDLKFFTDAARLGKGEVLADTMTSYCREGSR